MGWPRRGARHHGYTGQPGYHPLLAVAVGTGEVLMARLREGAVSLPLQVGTRVELPAYAETPAVREIQLVIDLPDVSAIQCAAVTDARWEQPTIGTITTRNTYCGGVPLGGAIGQVLVKNSDDDCAVEWATLRTVPGSGLDGQILTWGSSGGEGAYGWAGP